MTPRAAAVATAASTALPPLSSTCMPTLEASWSTVATAPPVPVAVGCLGDSAGGALEAGCAMPRTASRRRRIAARRTVERYTGAFTNHKRRMPCMSFASFTRPPPPVTNDISFPEGPRNGIIGTSMVQCNRGTDRILRPRVAGDRAGFFRKQCPTLLLRRFSAGGIMFASKVST